MFKLQVTFPWTNICVEMCECNLAAIDRCSAQKMFFKFRKTLKKLGSVYN